MSKMGIFKFILAALSLYILRIGGEVFTEYTVTLNNIQDPGRKPKIFSVYKDNDGKQHLVISENIEKDQGWTAKLEAPITNGTTGVVPLCDLLDIAAGNKHDGVKFYKLIVKLLGLKGAMCPLSSRKTEVFNQSNLSTQKEKRPDCIKNITLYVFDPGFNVALKVQAAYGGMDQKTYACKILYKNQHNQLKEEEEKEEEDDEK